MFSKLLQDFMVLGLAISGSKVSFNPSLVPITFIQYWGGGILKFGLGKKLGVSFNFGEVLNGLVRKGHPKQTFLSFINLVEPFGLGTFS